MKKALPIIILSLSSLYVLLFFVMVVYYIVSIRYVFPIVALSVLALGSLALFILFLRSYYKKTKMFKKMCLVNLVFHSFTLASVFSVLLYFLICFGYLDLNDNPAFPPLFIFLPAFCIVHITFDAAYLLKNKENQQ